MDQSKKYGYLAILLIAVIASSGMTYLYYSKIVQTKAEEVVSLKKAKSKLDHSLNEYKKLANASNFFLEKREAEAQILFDQLAVSSDSLILKVIENHIQQEKIIVVHQNDVKEKTNQKENLPVLIVDDFETKKELIETKKELAVKIFQLEKIQKAKPILNLTSSKGKKFQYIGQMNGSVATGFGIGIFETGSIYKGYWKNNMREGKGIFTWKDDEHYEGQFVADNREGYGIYYWKNGEVYKGNWKHDKREGKGILYGKNGKIKEEGVWKNDIFK
jgi:hypothetical protein